MHLLAIERVAPDARVLGLRLVPVLHEHEDRTRPDDGGAGLEDGAAHVIPVRGGAAVLEEDEINALLGLVLHREAEPVEDAARPLLLGIEPELTALRLHVVIPGKRLPHASVQRQLDEPAVILPLSVLPCLNYINLPCYQCSKLHSYTPSPQSRPRREHGS